MNSQLNKLNTPLNKFSFKGHENTEFLPTLTLPIDNDNNNERCDRTLTNIDSGFTELTTNDNLTVDFLEHQWHLLIQKEHEVPRHIRIQIGRLFLILH